METAFVVGSLAWNTGLVSITGFLVKRWMDKQESNSEQNRVDVKATAASLAENLKAAVATHKEEINASNEKIEEGLREIFAQLRLANGRTAKIEGELGTVKALCSERHSK